MYNLYNLPGLLSGFAPIYLNLISLISIISGILTIISKNPIISVLYLIFLFTNISCYLILLGAIFLGLSYLLVYVGAVSILFLFILMLINIRVSELVSNNKNNIPLAIITTATFYIPYNEVLPGSEKDLFLNFNLISQDVREYEELVRVSSNNWDNNLSDIYDIISIGNVMYTNLSMWLVITSIILLLSMVGSIIITVKQKY